MEDGDDEVQGDDVPGKVAVIAVHGVGAPEFGDTARRLATLLHRHGSARTSNVGYSTFVETSIEVPVERWNSGSIQGSSHPPDVHFSLKAIEKLDDCDCLAHYRTIKLSGTRTDAIRGATAVDVYEMRWADLSSGTRILTKFVVELYQIYFHLASLGRKTVISASESSNALASPLSRLVMHGSATMHQWIEALLPTAIPIANLFFLVPTLALVALWVPHTWAPWIAAAIVALAILAASVWLLFAARAAPMMLPVLLFAGGAIVLTLRIRLSMEVALGYLAMLAGFFFAWAASRWLMSRYKARTRNLSAAAGAIITLIFFAAAIEQQRGDLGSESGVLGIAVWMAAAMFLLLQIFWLLLFLLLAAICLLSLAGGIAGIGSMETRALRTGRLGALVSTTLFFLTTALLWAALLAQVQKVDGIGTILEFGCGFPRLLYLGLSKTFTLSHFTATLFDLTVGTRANQFLIIAVAALILAASSVLPSAWYETKPPSVEVSKGPLALRLKTWLDRSGWMLWPAEIALMISLVALASGYRLVKEGTAIDDWISMGGVLIAAAVPFAVLLRTQLPRAAAAILDIALDVSNWLKERPFNVNPRGRIMTRYIALLKAVCAEDRYDKIIVVAHSQGTVISADLFRMLRHTRWPAQIPPIELLTAGCPLKQLYLSRFPVWYGWALNPDHRPLGIERWINAYRTGDYVGRDLWGGANNSSSLSKSATRIDISLGGGAHTHYFDETSPEVGKIVDWMIS